MPLAFTLRAMTERFECWFSLSEVAERLGKSPRTVRRLMRVCPELQQAARFVCGEWHLPESAVVAWLKARPQWGSIEPRDIAHRPDVRTVSKPVTARTEGELRRKLEVPE